MSGALRFSRTWFAGLLGAALLAGSPIIAQGGNPRVEAPPANAASNVRFARIVVASGGSEAGRCSSGAS